MLNFCIFKNMDIMKLGNGEFTFMKKFDQKLGYVLRTERRAKKMYQPQIAKELNVSKMTVSYWETGKHSMTAEQLKRYCEVIGVSVQSVLDRTD